MNHVVVSLLKYDKPDVADYLTTTTDASQSSYHLIQACAQETSIFTLNHFRLLLTWSVNATSHHFISAAESFIFVSRPNKLLLRLMLAS